jgi:hypothetical protein
VKLVARRKKMRQNLFQIQKEKTSFSIYSWTICP